MGRSLGDRLTQGRADLLRCDNAETSGLITLRNNSSLLVK
jgi:hypothetical protein